MIVANETVNGFLGGRMTKVDLLRFIPFRLNRLAAEVSRELAGVYSDRFGIDITEWRVLATLAMGEPRSAGFVVRCTRTHKSKVSRAVTRLALAGLLEGVPSNEDRRETKLRMTERGRALYAELVPLVLEHEQRLASCLSQDELRGFTTALDKLERSLGLIQDPEPDPRLRESPGLRPGTRRQCRRLGGIGDARHAAVVSGLWGRPAPGHRRRPADRPARLVAVADQPFAVQRDRRERAGMHAEAEHVVRRPARRACRGPAGPRVRRRRSRGTPE